MKRLFLIITTLVLSVSLLACTEEDPVDYTSELTAEYNRITSNIPDNYRYSITLPEASTRFTVQYELDGTVLSNRVLVYQSTSENITKTLVITISYEGQDYSDSITIVQLLDDTLDVTELAFQDAYDSIEARLPNPIVSNTVFPTEWNGMDLEYTQTCGALVRGQLVYPFPMEEETCDITYQVTLNQETRSLTFPLTISSVNDIPKIPKVYITTTNNTPIESKEEYVTATMTVVTFDDSNYDEIVNAPLQIRLRGNSTLYMPKLSYKVKFDEKTKFLSDYREKDWVLLANFADQSLIRNALAFSLAERLGMAFAPKQTFVDVYVNNVYQGNYLLTDQVEVTNDRVDIEENIADIDTGYLIEYDHTQYLNGLGESGDNYFLINDIPFVIKSPDIDDNHYLPEHKLYIETYMNTLFNILENQNDYSPYIDEASFVDWFIVNELFKNVDSGYSSIYYYKDKGGLLHMGPVWDFDLSTGNPGHLEDSLRGPTGWYTNLPYKNIIFYYLMQYDSFQEALKSRWNEMYEDAIYPTLEEVWITAGSITESRYRNFQLWDVIGSNEDWYTAPEILALETYDEQVWFLYDYLKERMEWLHNEINRL